MDKNNFHVIVVKDDNMTSGMTEEAANAMAKDKLFVYDGCSVIVVKYVRIFNHEGVTICPST